MPQERRSPPRWTPAPPPRTLATPPSSHPPSPATPARQPPPRNLRHATSTPAAPPPPTRPQVSGLFAPSAPPPARVAAPATRDSAPAALSPVALTTGNQVQSGWRRSAGRRAIRSTRAIAGRPHDGQSGPLGLSPVVPSTIEEQVPLRSLLAWRRGPRGGPGDAPMPPPAGASPPLPPQGRGYIGPAVAAALFCRGPGGRPATRAARRVPRQAAQPRGCCRRGLRPLPHAHITNKRQEAHRHTGDRLPGQPPLPPALCRHPCRHYGIQRLRRPAEPHGRSARLRPRLGAPPSRPGGRPPWTPPTPPEQTQLRISPSILAASPFFTSRKEEAPEPHL